MMSINPINSNDNRNFSVPKAGALGAALGYVSTYAVPLTTEEHAKYFTKSVQKGIDKKVLKARKGEIKAITSEFKEGGIKPLVKDTFKKSAKALEKNPEKLIGKLSKNKKMGKANKNILMDLYRRVENTGNVTEMIENSRLSLAAKKDSRAGLYFALVGSLALMSFAVIKNSLATLFPKSHKKAETRTENMKDLDYIIECGEVPAEIYIFGFGGAGKKAQNKA